MAQATAVQALGRASQLLDRPDYLDHRAQGAAGLLGLALGGRGEGPRLPRRAALPPVLVRPAAVHHERLPPVGDRAVRLRQDHRRPAGPRAVAGRRARGRTRGALLRHRRLVALQLPRPRVRPGVPRAAARVPGLDVQPPADAGLLHHRSPLPRLPDRSRRARPPGPATATQNQPTRIRFFVNKRSAVQVVVTRDGDGGPRRTATFRRGEGSFEWTPRASGTYTIRLSAKELRTGQGPAQPHRGIGRRWRGIG